MKCWNHRLFYVWRWLFILGLLFSKSPWKRKLWGKIDISRFLRHVVTFGVFWFHVDYQELTPVWNSVYVDVSNHIFEMVSLLLSFFDYARPLCIMVYQYWSWKIMVHHDGSYLVMINHDPSWWIMFHHDRAWVTMINHGRP